MHKTERQFDMKIAKRHEDKKALRKYYKECKLSPQFCTTFGYRSINCSISYKGKLHSTLLCSSLINWENILVPPQAVCADCSLRRIGQREVER